MKFQKTLLAGSVALAIASGQTYAAFGDAGTDYSNAKQHAHMWTPGMEALDTVNSILCFVEQLKAGEMVNKGLYTALVNEAKCDTGGGDSRDKGPKQQFVIVESVRASDTAAQKAKVWIPGMPMGDGMKGLVKAYASISAEPTETDPLQDFTLRFDMYMQDEDGNVGSKMGSGYIKATPSTELQDGKIGIEFFESSQFGTESYESAAKIIKNPDGSDGVAITKSPSWDQEGGGDKYYGLSWNETTQADRVKIKDGDFANNNSDLNGAEMCLAKDQLKTAVWQYGVYEKDSGDEVTLNSGFPISYGDNKHGYIGYWGVWTEDETVPSSDVYKIDYTTEPPTKTEISIDSAPGKLWKNTLKELAIADIAGVEFEYGAWDETDGWQNYLIAYDTDSSQFQKLATVEWGENGMEVTELETPEPLTINNGERLFLWSNQLGGQVTISKDSGGQFDVVIAERSLVTPNSDELDGGSLSLTCFDRCPKANISKADISSDSIYQNTDFDTGYSYSLNKDTMTLTTDNENVAFASDVTEDDLQGSNYQWGVQSGILVAGDASGISSFDDLYGNASLTTWYEWETGLQNWNRYTMVSDSEGNVITFDEPMKFELDFDANMARNTASQSQKFDGQKFFLEYGGNGDLWGFPNVDVGDGFYYPAIALKDGTELTKSGDNAANYVVKAWQMEQKMSSVDASDCNNLALGDVPGGIPTAIDATLPVNTDDVPSVEGLEPSVINGVVQ